METRLHKPLFLNGKVMEARRPRRIPWANSCAAVRLISAVEPPWCIATANLRLPGLHHRTRRRLTFPLPAVPPPFERVSNRVLKWFAVAQLHKVQITHHRYLAGDVEPRAQPVLLSPGPCWLAHTPAGRSRINWAGARGSGRARWPGSEVLPTHQVRPCRIRWRFGTAP